MKSKKIGVITYWWSETNYGQILQLYALQTFLRKEGYDPFLIRYLPETSSKKKSAAILKILDLANFFSRCVNRLTEIVLDFENKNYNRRFREFLDKYVNQTPIYSSLGDLQNTPPLADVYITGSDIVWSAMRPAFFLDFGNKDITRIAYAASFGSDTLSNEMVQFISQYLQNFSFVGLREKSGVDMVKKLDPSANVELVLDPTLLLTQNDYASIAKIPIKKDVCQFFIYLTAAKIGFSIYDIKRAIDPNIELVYTVCNRVDIHQKNFLSIEEWLGYYLNSDFIITNSFHGCIFSIIFSKKFVFLPMVGEYENLNDRIFSLLNILGLNSRICYNLNDILRLSNVDVDYNGVYKKLHIHRSISSNLLIQSLNM